MTASWRWDARCNLSAGKDLMPRKRDTGSRIAKINRSERVGSEGDKYRGKMDQRPKSLELIKVISRDFSPVP